MQQDIFKLYRRNTPPGTNQELPDYIPTPKERGSYLPSEELTAAVNVAIALNQPLLLTGEPGTGKTELAYHIAHYFGLGKPYIFNAQTISAKKDLFYTYDALGHFHAVNIKDRQEMGAAEIEAKYINYEALGMAINQAIEDKEKYEKGGEKPKRSVVLIDEIDKAPRDLPNDLLTAIEKLTFDVIELSGGKKTLTCPPELSPIIIITSNSEKNLPDAFLRRVVYHHINFPDDDAARILEILQAKKLTGLDDDDLNAVIAHFTMIRKEKKLDKKPATAELIAWAALLPQIGIKATQLQNIAEMNQEDRKKLNYSYGVLAKSEDDLKKITLTV